MNNIDKTENVNYKVLNFLQKNGPSSEQDISDAINVPIEKVKAELNSYKGKLAGDIVLEFVTNNITKYYMHSDGRQTPIRFLNHCSNSSTNFRKNGKESDGLAEKKRYHEEIKKELIDNKVIV